MAAGIAGGAGRTAADRAGRAAGRARAVVAAVAGGAIGRARADRDRVGVRGAVRIRHRRAAAAGARLQSDAFYYFAYLRSIAFDRDVDFTNDYPLLGLGDKAYLWQPPTATGYAHSAWTIGPAIVWAPFFGAGHLAAERQQGLGLQVATDGTSYPYRQAVCIAGLFYALLGTWFSIRAARQFFSGRDCRHRRRPRRRRIVHPLVRAGRADDDARADDGRGRRVRLVLDGDAWAADRWLHWIGLGALAGFAGLVRWQSVLFALLPAIEALVALWRSGRARDTAALRATLVGGVAFMLAATVAFIPQMLAWKAIYGHYLAVSPVGPQIYWANPHLVDVLFASQNGLFATSPILYVAAIGLVLFARRRPAVGVPAARR